MHLLLFSVVLSALHTVCLGVGPAQRVERRSDCIEHTDDVKATASTSRQFTDALMLRGSYSELDPTLKGGFTEALSGGRWGVVEECVG